MRVSQMPRYPSLHLFLFNPPSVLTSPLEEEEDREKERAQPEGESLRGAASHVYACRSLRQRLNETPSARARGMNIARTVAGTAPAPHNNVHRCWINVR